MKEIPIIFSAPMVCALLDGRKTMTRRLATRPRRPSDKRVPGEATILPTPWTCVRPGDRLWVRENLKLISVGPDNTRGIQYAADGDMGQVHFFTPDNPGKLKPIGITPCIHMPRWASRLTLVVTATKIERLNDISLSDVRAEGLQVRQISLFGADAAERQKIGALHFRALWDSLHGAGAWEANPEVVALSFRIALA